MIQKLVIVRNSVKEGRNVQKQNYRNYFQDAVIQSIAIFLKFSQTSIRRRETNLTSNQTTVNISRMLGYRSLMFFEIQHKKEKKLYVKPDCRKYYPDAVKQKLNMIRNSAKECEKRSETRLPYLFPVCCDTVDCYYSKFSHTTIRMRETNLT